MCAFFSFRKWFARLFAAPCLPLRRRVLLVESLEDRTALATFGPPAGPIAISDCYSAPPPKADFTLPVSGNTSAANAAKWAQPGGLGAPVTITYSYANLLDGGMSGVSADQLKAAVQEALSRWAAAAPLNFVEVPDAGPAPTSVNESDYSARGLPMLRFGHVAIDGPSNILAQTYYPGQTGLAGDLFFDQSERWSVNPATGIDFLEVAEHEIGHALGLGHEPPPSQGGISAIMNPYYGGRFHGLGTSFLYQDDINGIQTLYGSRPGSVTPLSSVGAPNPNPVNATLPFSDNFNRANSQYLGQAWTDYFGDFQVSGNRAVNSYQGVAFSLLNGVAATDEYAQADINVTAGSGRLAGLLTRFSSSGYYRVDVAATAGGVVATLYAYTSWGGQTALDSAAISGTGTLRLETVGTSQKVFFNGVLVLSATDASVTTPGTVGIKAGGPAGTSLDNFYAGSIASSATLPFSDSFTTATGQQLNNSAWSETYGNFRVAGGTASNASAGISVAVLRGVAATDEYAQANINVTAGSGRLAGLLTRFSSSGYYRVDVAATAGGVVATLYAYTSWGGQTALDSAAISGTGTLRLETVGTSQKVFFNGVLVLSATDASVTTPGTVGIKAGGPAGTSLDNFYAGSIASSATLPFSDSFTTATGQQLNNSAWSETYGNFRVAGGTASNASAGISVAVLRGVAATDEYAQANINVTAGSRRLAGLLTQYSSSGYYRAEVEATARGYTISLIRYTASGGFLTLASASFSGNASGLLRIETRPGSQKVYLGGRLLFTSADAAVGAGSVGMKVGGPAGTALDNFSAGRI